MDVAVPYVTLLTYRALELGGVDSMGLTIGEGGARNSRPDFLLM